ncbi:MAG: DUF4440 domain-containing protein [Deltaproteobacteria bacterium]|nr:DUF4440 domain-containing protein [Deltaproteobacteria bacterium]
MSTMSQDSTIEIDQRVESFFSIFDNRGERAPDFSKLESMFLPGAIITKCCEGQRETMTLEEFIAPRTELFQSGSLRDFHEWETKASTFVNGITATRICAYRKEGLLEGKVFSGRGTKSIQLIKTRKGWQIISILWEDF